MPQHASDHQQPNLSWAAWTQAQLHAAEGVGLQLARTLRAVGGCVLIVWFVAGVVTGSLDPAAVLGGLAAAFDQWWDRLRGT